MKHQSQPHFLMSTETTLAQLCLREFLQTVNYQTLRLEYIQWLKATLGKRNNPTNWKILIYTLAGRVGQNEIIPRLTRVMRTDCEMVYHCHKVAETSKMLCRCVYMTGTLAIGHFLSTLTLCASVEYTPLWMYCGKVDPQGPLCYILVWLGLFNHRALKDVEELIFIPRDTEFAGLLQIAMKTPLSLLQLARQAVRNCMRDVYVLEDCYKLPIPTAMKHYLSFKCINADIRPLFLDNELPDTRSDPQRMEGSLKAVKKGLHQRYNIYLDHSE